MKMVVAWHRHSFQEVVWEVVVQHACRMLSLAVICGGGPQAPRCCVGRCEVLRWRQTVVDPCEGCGQTNIELGRGYVQQMECCEQRETLGPHLKQ